MLVNSHDRQADRALDRQIDVKKHECIIKEETKIIEKPGYVTLYVAAYAHSKCERTYV